MKFYKDNFIDFIPFDYLEIQVIEEDPEDDEQFPDIETLTPGSAATAKKEQEQEAAAAATATESSADKDKDKNKKQN